MSRIRIGAAVAAMFTMALAPTLASAEIVYDNSVTILGYFFPAPSLTGVEYGDEVTLAGTNRAVTEIVLGVHMNAPGPNRGDVKARIYQGGMGPPAVMLWESELRDNVEIPAGLTEFSFTVPNVTVPETIIWTIQISDFQGPNTQGAGMRLADPPAVGTSPNSFWAFDLGGPGTGWGLWWFGGTPVANFYARINAEAGGTPCPGSPRGDANCDGTVNNFDIDCFVAALVGGEPGWAACANPGCDFVCVNDINGDTRVDNFDIDPFVQCLLNAQNPCP